MSRMGVTEFKHWVALEPSIPALWAYHGESNRGDNIDNSFNALMAVAKRGKSKGK